MLPRALAVGVLLASASAAPAMEFSARNVVHQEKSLYRNIMVMERGDQRCMIFSRRGGRQGCMDLADPGRVVLSYTQGFFAGFFAKPSPRRVLILGLGIGTMPMTIRAYDPSIRIDTVELDPAVLEVARRYFGFREDSRSRVHVDDGRVFVRKQRRAGVRYDMVLIDAFDVKYIPEHMLTREFLGEVMDVLEPDGLVVSNTFSNGALQPYETATYQSVFGSMMTVETTTGNRIILSGRDGLPSIDAMTRNARRIDARLAPFGISSAALLRELRMQPRETGVRPLTDQYSPANLLLSY
jgi:spermidine synthase